MSRVNIEQTSDGSHTLFVPDLNEHYHSVNGAIQESLHVFIDAGLYHCAKPDIQVFEVGFGTGLNAFLTLTDNSYTSVHIHYTSIEAYPLSKEITDSLNYAQIYSPENACFFEKIHDTEWNKDVEITDRFTLHKIEADFVGYDWDRLSAKADLIYFDAFAPDKQPEMWSQDIFDNIYRITADGGILVTYCAKGCVRRMMQSAGFDVERLPGPPGKREMLRGTKPENI